MRASLAIIAATALTALGRAPAPPAEIVAPARAWSPLDQTLAFVRGKEAQYSDIYTAKADGSSLRRLTLGPGFKYDPDWSPNGRRILYRYEPPTGARRTFGGVVVMRSDGRDKIDIARRAAVYGGPATWAPSGTLIAFSGEKKGERHPGIYLIRPNAKGLKRLTSPRWEAQYPAWSPDGRKIAFAYVVNGGFNVYVMNADGGRVAFVAGH